jgi:hypothetical protein
MSIKRLKSWLLALGMQLSVASAALAQAPAYMPGIGTLDLFAQPDLTPYGGGSNQASGWFGSFEALSWATSNPRNHEVGVQGGSRMVYSGNSAGGGANPTFTLLGTTPATTPNGGPISIYNLPNTGATAGNGILVTPNSATGLPMTLETNTASTAWIQSALQGGIRFETGYIDEDGGFMLSAFQLFDHVQSHTDTNASMVFNDPGATVYNAFNGMVLTTTPGATANSPTNISSTTFVAPTTLNLPLLNGFVFYGLPPGTTAGASNNVFPNGTQAYYAADLNGNGIFGPNGRDRGLASPYTGTNAQVDGVPDRELNNGGSTAVPGPGQIVQNLPIDYGDAVPLPLVFGNLTQQLTTSMWGTEVSRMWRLHPGPRGGNWDVFSGARYFRFSDQYNVNATGGILDASYWNTASYNNLVGPQIGYRWTKKWTRLSFSTEGRLTTAANFQTIRQNGVIGSNLTNILQTSQPVYTTVTTPAAQTAGVGVGPNNNATTGLNTGGPAGSDAPNSQTTYQTQQANNPGGGIPDHRVDQPLNLLRTGFSSTANAVTFSPLVEFRAKLNYQVFQGMTLSAGWTGIYADGMARAPYMVDYTLPSMGILANNNSQYIFVNGLSLGVEVNR